MKTGLLLINLGTPDAPNLRSVWRYLGEFLADKRVISLPAPLRFLLLYGIILPFRVAKSTHAYQAIWTERGSPLRFHGQDLRDKLQQYLGSGYQVEFAMRYGHPSIKASLANLQDCERLLIMPLYPQYSSAATGSSLEAVLTSLGRQMLIPHVNVIREFYQHPAFIQTLARKIAPFLPGQDKLVFSYHGLPERQVQQAGCRTLCTKPCVLESQSLSHPHCYRMQCYKTSQLLAQALGLSEQQYVTVFQSRLGRTPWIKPYMEDHLLELVAQGIKRIVMACPAFVADCLETLEEIGMRMRETWLALGGESVTLIPCLNSDDAWCEAILSIIPANE